MSSVQARPLVEKGCMMYRINATVHCRAMRQYLYVHCMSLCKVKRFDKIT